MENLVCSVLFVHHVLWVPPFISCPSSSFVVFAKANPSPPRHPPQKKSTQAKGTFFSDGPQGLARDLSKRCLARRLAQSLSLELFEGFVGIFTRICLRRPEKKKKKKNFGGSAPKPSGHPPFNPPLLFSPLGSTSRQLEDLGIGKTPRPDKRKTSLCKTNKKKL